MLKVRDPQAHDSMFGRTLTTILIQSQNNGHPFTSLDFGMDLELDTSDEMASPGHSHKWNLRVAVITLLTTGVALFTVTWLALHPSGGHTGITTPPGVVFPVGTLNALQPSGYSPPGPHALRGYHLNYSNDFSGTKVPSGWYLFDGVPGGLPGAQFSSAHVVVKNGVLQLNTWRDPRFHLKWVTGGLCQCGFPQTYEAYFVRSRITGAGPNEVQLLWPASNTWPPEIDFGPR